MFGRETRMLLRHYLEQGTSKSELARQLGVSRDTIHRWIRDGELDRDLEVDGVAMVPVHRCPPSSIPISRSLKRDSRPIRSSRLCVSSTRFALAGMPAATRS